MTPKPLEKPGKLPGTEGEALDFIISLVYQKCRIRLHEGKEQLIRGRLGKRMRQLGITSLPDYCTYLQSGHDQEELTHMVDALTTNFTNFLREEEHFKCLVHDALPEVIGNSKKFTVWSAACATGEEAYTTALYLNEFFPLNEGWDWQVLATDISSRALSRAREGVYPLNKVESMPKEWLKKYFQKGVGEWEGHCRVKPILMDRVRFQQINLLSGFIFDKPFESILCRNVMIYFDRATQQELVQHLAKFLVPSGYLFIGHSESLNGMTVPFQCLRPSIYRKKDS